MRMMRHGFAATPSLHVPSLALMSSSNVSLIVAGTGISSKLAVVLSVSVSGRDTARSPSADAESVNVPGRSPRIEKNPSSLAVAVLTTFAPSRSVTVAPRMPVGAVGGASETRPSMLSGSDGAVGPLALDGTLGATGDALFPLHPSMSAALIARTAHNLTRTAHEVFLRRPYGNPRGTFHI